MYIAFKWLTGLALAMWLAMCLIDFYIKSYKEIRKKGFGLETFEWTYKNVTDQLETEIRHIRGVKLYDKKYRHHDSALLHYAMFFAGAIAVSVFNKKREIVCYTKKTISKIYISSAMKLFTDTLKKTAVVLNVATFKYFAILWAICYRLFYTIKNMKHGMKTNIIEKHKRINLILLQKLKEFGDERKKLGQLLIAAIHENKNIKTQFQLESMAKNRLVKYVEETQKKIKENRSKFVSFQQLYLITHQENTFLKARIRKLTIEKENAEKDLMAIITEVYKSKNNDLKVFCSRFVVRPKDSLLNNASADVQKFLQKSYSSAGSTWRFSSLNNTENINENKFQNSVNDHVTEILHSENSLVPLITDAPKLKGLPGECIWTVKDKDGIIEKLYEYDYESDFDNGDTIRRIREYSVYYDKDCLLDFTRSRTLVTEPVQLTLRSLYPTNERFLTGSEAFQKFLQNNKNIVPLPRSSPPPLLC